METLPVELLHRIFDNLDTETILFSIRPVSRLFRSVVATYDRYILNMKLISKSNFYLLCRFIKPQNVISLILSNNERTLDQIDLFLSFVRLRQFTRLRSLNLLNIDEGQLNIILKQINLNLLTSFSVSIRKYDDRRIKTTNNLLTSTLTNSNLHQLKFDITTERMSKVLWPFNCTIQNLTINNYITIDNLCTILQCSPHLHTIIMKKNFDDYNNDTIPTFSSLMSFRQLTSLTIENLSITIDKLESFLSLIPSLVYLKLIGGRNMLDGKRWEQFIEIYLPQLDKFEFYFDEWYGNRKTSADLELTIASFQTPFWIEQKKWFVACEYNIDYSSTIHLYSIPICKASLRYEPEFKKFSLFTSVVTTENKSTIMNNVKYLRLTMNKAIADDIREKKTMINQPLFPKVTEINLVFWDDWPQFSMQSLSIFINIGQITQMELKSYFFDEYKNDTLIDISIFLGQAHNLSSLIIRSSLNEYRLPRIFDNIYSIIPRQLKHLHLPINSLDQMRMIIERCKNLSTIEFDIKSKYSKEIMEWFNDNTIKSICKKDGRTISVWLGKKKIQSIDVRIDNKRIKLTDN